jgi:hypothetical protein
LAEAVGISAFHPREMLKERAGGGRFSFFWHKAKRNRLLQSREVTKVAVKSIKGLTFIFQYNFIATILLIK